MNFIMEIHGLTVYFIIFSEVVIQYTFGIKIWRKVSFFWHTFGRGVGWKVTGVNER